MKKIFAITCVVCSFITVFAQQNKQVTKDQLGLFKKSTTYVVMDNNPMLGYNITIKAAVDKYWKITPFKVISYETFDSIRNKPDHSFILLTKANLTKDKREAEYLYLNILMGSRVKEINDMPEILTLPLDYTGVDENSYTYKVGVMIRFAQEHVKLMMSSDRITQFRNLKYYNINVRDIKTKTLLVEQRDLSEEVNSLEKIKAIYSYPVKIVSSDDIEKAVFNQTPNTLILHQIEPGEEDNIGRSYKIIYGVDDNKIYYFNFENISQKRPAGMLAKDFRRIEGY
jgi:hypothetical protein